MSGFLFCSLTWASSSIDVVRASQINSGGPCLVTPFGRENASLSSRPAQLANEKSHPTWMAFCFAPLIDPKYNPQPLIDYIILYKTNR
jgi:hypothetical protein